MIRPALAMVALAALVSAAHAGPADKAKAVVDPDCTPTKAAKGAARKATVGVGNRCGAAETARDVAGVDGKKPMDAATSTVRPAKQ